MSHVTDDDRRRFDKLVTGSLHQFGHVWAVHLKPSRRSRLRYSVPGPCNDNAWELPDPELYRFHSRSRSPLKNPLEAFRQMHDAHTWWTHNPPPRHLRKPR